MLISVIEAQTYMQITGADALVSGYIGYATAMLSGRLGYQSIEAGSYTDEVLDTNFESIEANPPEFFELNPIPGYPYTVKPHNFPVSNLVLNNNGDTVETEDYTQDATSGTIYLKFRPGRFDLKATYTGGYTSATLPQDLKYLLLDLVSSLYKSNSRGNSSSSGIDSLKVGDYSVTYGKASSVNDVFTNNEGIIQRYMVISL